MSSDVQVFVRFAESSVFAGEEVKCTITFRNVADLSENIASGPGFQAQKFSVGSLASTSRLSNRRNVQLSQPSTTKDQAQTGGNSRHKTTVSLSVSSDLYPSNPNSRAESPRYSQVDSFKSRRSPSTFATGPTEPSDSQTQEPGEPSRVRRSAHTRSSTVQITPGNLVHADGALSPGPRKLRQTYVEQHSARKLSEGQGGHAPGETIDRGSLALASASLSQGTELTPSFRFPSEAPADGSVDATSERSSAEFHSLSNHSQETLISEQPSMVSELPSVAQQRTRLHQHNRDASLQGNVVANLLMGYAQVNATFTLDGSLVDQSSFEEVKRKGFLGGQAGGGVVGMKRAQPKSGLLGAFNFQSIGESLGGFMGGNEMSSVKEMKAVANARTIPLLSTPQSLLFVDLRLGPGDEKSFSFTYRLPHGLPSSHRGKAIKISYNLTVGVQNAPGSRNVQSVRSVNVPLRVFSGVNQAGEVLGHDLMQPHIVLRDSARTALVDLSMEDHRETPKTPGATERASLDFLDYIHKLLEKKRRRQSSSGTIDAMSSTFTSKTSEHRASSAIERAILLSNQASSGENSHNRFEIAREGLKVAVVVLDRPLHRLGETITAMIDFTEGQVLCSSVRATLETQEKVSGSLAIRSAASISRVTRKVYATHSENTLFARRVVFSPSIPETGTPTFITTGVSLDWHLRFEFGVTRGDTDSEQGGVQQFELLEDIVEDERGTIKAAVEYLDTETFEVTIPVTIYGDVVHTSRDDQEIVGLPI